MTFAENRKTTFPGHVLSLRLTSFGPMRERRFLRPLLPPNCQSAVAIGLTAVVKSSFSAGEKHTCLTSGCRRRRKSKERVKKRVESGP
jgi:hypothetical protein